MSLTRSPTSPAIADRIDRLSRGAHAFHRFAHHPLCREYASEVFLIGRRFRLCRGCTLAAVGALAGVAFALWADSSWIVAAATAPPALVLASPRMRAAGKIATRLLPAGLCAFSIAAGARTGTVAGAGVCVFVFSAVALCVALYRRRGPHRGPCLACPERARPEPCRGFAPIVRRERAFERLAGTWLSDP